ncbi:DUF3069 domain-containing protein [Vibrio rumoiensis]|uniref:DUF3069 domain-containing protein n=1 Tax=Vibrio rumoiensis 1S-45 TaxID=1188252 RepID=A0A1E5DZ80_9VIBR|nr:DUF3069 domain-containing protein [Vibrio rumoiensis]OEF23217.1 hypothetical protein A1QC_12665 [Vibrio rumoiensis 1S-45]
MSEQQEPVSVEEIDTENNALESVDLSTYSPELRHLIEFEQVPEQAIPMVTSIHEVSEEPVRDVWDELPASAQNILDNFEQFHALISIGQTFAAIDFMQEFETLNMPADMDEAGQADYRASLLDKVLQNCVKDMVKQLKKARRDPILKRDFMEIFAEAK